jgi:hypothetical protein
MHAPKEFLLVDLVNNIGQLAESEHEVLSRVKERAPSFNVPRLQRVAQDYGTVRTKKFFSQALSAPMTLHAS